MELSASDDELLDTAFAEVVLTAEWLTTDIRARVSDENDPVSALRLLNSVAKVLCRLAKTQKAIMQLKVAEQYREKAMEEFEAAKATLEKAREKMQHSKRPRRRRFPRRLAETAAGRNSKASSPQERAMSDQPAVFKQIPHCIHYLFESPPILQSESADHYFRLLAECICFYEPHEIVDWIYLKDFVDYTWEVFRTRKMRLAVAGDRAQTGHQHRGSARFSPTSRPSR